MTDPHWFKDAVLYEVHVRAFADSDGDGIGDFKGLTSKLDYLQDLGVTALWLLPFYPSPLRDDGYDIAGYTSVHPDYGTLDDFVEFLAEAHRRGLRVVTELVLNHTSDQHPWFRAARHAPAGSAARDFYVWSDDNTRYSDARIIFKDFEASNWTWDPVANAYYWHRFYSHQPDLNFDNPAVQAAMLEVLDFWLGLGVDGLRLDAIPYLFEREGTNCENLPETHDFLRKLRRHVDERFPGRMLLAEANQWPEDAIAYFGKGDECHMAFHFPVMPRLFMAIHMEDRHPIVEILRQTPPIPEGCQWAVFLRNHDELTLEMVTDEDRDYMYRVYARDSQARINLGIRRRLAPLLGNHRRRIELMNGLLFSLPGTPIVYYGDEIGMGDNFYLGDRDGVRTPMQWSGDENAGFSRANPQRLYLPVIVDAEYHWKAVNVEAQTGNRHSLLWWTKRLVALRRELPALGRGTIEFLAPENRKVLVFIRRHGDQAILVVANLSRFAQWAALDLSAFEGCVPRELVGRVRFPPVTRAPYVLTLGPHSFHWFLLERAPASALAVGPAEELPALAGPGIELATAPRGGIERALAAYLGRCPWFKGKSRTLLGAEVVESLTVGAGTETTRMLLVQVAYGEGEPEVYVVPLRLAPASEKDVSAMAVARVPSGTGSEALLVDATGDGTFLATLLGMVARQTRLRAEVSELRGVAIGAPLAPVPKESGPVPTATEAAYASSVRFGESFVLKLFRRIEPGVNPDLEIGRVLTARAFPRARPLLGALELTTGRSEPRTVALVHGFVPHEGDAWRYTRDAVADFLERALAQRADLPPPARAGAGPDEPSSLTLREIFRPYERFAELLGRRTAELHGALASVEDPAFAPEPFTLLYQRSVQQALLTTASDVLDRLGRRLDDLAEEARGLAGRVLALEAALRACVSSFLSRKVDVRRIRVHGNYQLDHVLHTGEDLVLVDFEGRPDRPLTERRLKRCPLRDVTSLMRSIDHAAASVPEDRLRREDVPWATPWARWWAKHAREKFLEVYLTEIGPARLLPPDRAQLAELVAFYRLDDAVRDLGDCLRDAPERAEVPLSTILEIVAGSPPTRFAG